MQENSGKNSDLIKNLYIEAIFKSILKNFNIFSILQTISMDIFQSRLKTEHYKIKHFTI